MHVLCSHSPRNHQRLSQASAFVEFSESSNDFVHHHVVETISCTGNIPAQSTPIQTIVKSSNRLSVFFNCIDSIHKTLLVPKVSRRHRSFVFGNLSGLSLHEPSIELIQSDRHRPFSSTERKDSRRCGVGRGLVEWQFVVLVGAYNGIPFAWIDGEKRCIRL